LPVDLNPSNRPVRTRMPGGVAGDAERQSPRPYTDWNFPKTIASSAARTRSRIEKVDLKDFRGLGPKPIFIGLRVEPCHGAVLAVGVSSE
jgi:hypothetical protein